MIKYFLFLTALVFIFCEAAQADFYQWEDENGNINITDYPPPSKFSKKVRIHKPDYLPGETEQKMAMDAQKKEADVVLYTKNDCTDCDKAREFLKSQNIIFTEYNTDNDEEAAKKRKTIDDGDDVPFAVIHKNHVYGFSESIYNKLLNKKP